MQCPYCNEEFLSEGEVGRHVMANHPEKVMTPDQLAKAQEKLIRANTLASVSSSLTAVIVGNPGATVDSVVEIYKLVYTKLSEWV